MEQLEPRGPAASVSSSTNSPDAKPHAGTNNSSSSVQVAVRVRPMSASEEAQASEACVQAVGARVVLGDRHFGFDAAFPPQVPQQHVYEQLVAPLVDRVFDGYNATVFAYGQTGSGKTFTMGNEFKLSVAPGDRGIIPRAMDDIFRRVEAAPEDKKIVVKVSYLEVVYNNISVAVLAIINFLQILNEEIYDLLSVASNAGSTSASSTGLSVRDEGKRGIVVAGLSEHEVKSITQVASLLQAGALHRATAATVMNAQSSRSHAICTLTMEQYDNVSEGVEARFSKFHLVDLAGSERAKKTNTMGARFKEGVNINLGLLSLGNVINALCERSRSSSMAANHVPYRDSKLTRLLQDSLGGNSKTLMIACVSPADVNFEETSSTLRYASRARNIQNSAVVNKEMSAANEVAYLKGQLELLQLQLMQQQSKPSQARTRAMAASSEQQYQNSDIADLEAELHRWKNVVRTREEELRMVMSAKNKWKKVADEFLAKKKNAVPASSEFEGMRGAGSVASNAVSSTKALALEAMAFEETIQIQLPDAVTTTETLFASPGTQEQLQADLDNLSDVIVEKEKIMGELDALSSSSSTEARLASLTTSYEQKIITLETRVDQLAAAKKRLSLEIRTSGQSADTADQKNKEDVRVQLQKIQSQLQVAKQAEEECKRLTTLWKTGKFKISTLEQEIVDMKTQKTGLQQKLRAKADAYRKEKREQDLKILQLKRQDQRKQHELHKLTALHSKQHSVLKRKTEEVANANKRMRTMAFNQQQQQMKKKTQPAVARSSLPVDMQQDASRESGKPANRSDFMESVAKALEKTFEVRMTIQGAKNAIEMDLEERKRLALEISRLEEANSSAGGGGDALASLKDSLREKNAEIRLLQQKLASVERNNATPEELFPATATACHQIIRHLVETAVESKSSCMGLENSVADSDAMKAQLIAQTDKYEVTIAGLKQEMWELGRRGGILLDTFEFYSSRDGDVPEGTFQSSLFKRELDETKRALEALKLQLAMQASLDTMNKLASKKKKKFVKIIDVDEIVSSSEHEKDDEDDDCEDDDSDYVEYEGTRGATKHASRVSTIPSAGGKAQRASGVAGAGFMDEIDELLARPLCCTCNGKCATKGCACKAEKRKCGSECACNASKCHNREDFQGVKKSKKSRKSELDDKENEVESFFYAGVGVGNENEDPAPPPSKLKTLWSQHDSKMEQFGSVRKAKLSGSSLTPPSLLKKPRNRFLLKPASTNLFTSSSSSNSNISSSTTTASRVSRFL